MVYGVSDKTVCESFLDGSGSEFEICGLVELETEIDGSLSYVLDDYSLDEGDRFAHVFGRAYWYEDFPNLDLDLMQEGVTP